MKQLLANAVTALLTGIFFTLGIGLTIYAIDYFTDDHPSPKDLDYIQLPPGVTVIEHSQVQGTPSFTIVGVVENSSKTSWQSVSIAADILAAGVKVNSCETDLDDDFPPNARRAFKIECYGVSGTNVPSVVSYRVSVTSAGKSG